MKAKATGQVNDSWGSRLVRFNVLAPQIVEAILAGTQPALFNGTFLHTANVPIDWNEQIAILGRLISASHDTCGAPAPLCIAGPAETAMLLPAPYRQIGR